MGQTVNFNFPILSDSEVQSQQITFKDFRTTVNGVSNSLSVMVDAELKKIVDEIGDLSTLNLENITTLVDAINVALVSGGSGTGQSIQIVTKEEYDQMVSEGTIDPDMIYGIVGDSDYNAINIIISDELAASLNITDNKTVENAISVLNTNLQSKASGEAVETNSNNISTLQTDVTNLQTNVTSLQTAVNENTQAISTNTTHSNSLLNTENGIHGLRYYEDKLQANIENVWTDISSGSSSEYVSPTITSFSENVQLTTDESALYDEYEAYAHKVVIPLTKTNNRKVSIVTKDIYRNNGEGKGGNFNDQCWFNVIKETNGSITISGYFYDEILSQFAPTYNNSANKDYDVLQHWYSGSTLQYGYGTQAFFSYTGTNSYYVGNFNLTETTLEFICWASHGQYTQINFKVIEW